MRNALTPLVAALAMGALAACAGTDVVAPERSESVAPPAQPAGPVAPAAPPVTPAPTGAGSLGGVAFYVSPTSRAARQAEAWRTSRPADAALMARMANHAVADWFNGWSSDVRAAVADVVTRAQQQGRMAVLVAYNIPHRDCGLYSAGGVSADAYGAWIRAFASGLAGRRAIVIVEPDAIAGADCLTASQRDERYALIRDAVTVLATAGAFVYVDAGNSRWHTPSEMAMRLERAGIAQAQGFALNVSNFVGTAENVAFGDELSRRVGGKRYVIDTSRNGLGPAAGDAWCNPAGRALGPVPTSRTGYPLVDALLWIKVPGESDGSCNGAPAAGAWWPEYALGLAQRSTDLP